MDETAGARGLGIPPRQHLRFGLSSLLLLIMAIALGLGAVRQWGSVGGITYLVLATSIMLLRRRPRVTGPILLSAAMIYIVPYVALSALGGYQGVIACGTVCYVEDHWAPAIIGSYHPPITQILRTAYEPVYYLDELWVHRPYRHVTWPPGATLPTADLAVQPTVTGNAVLSIIAVWLMLGAVSVFVSWWPHRRLTWRCSGPRTATKGATSLL